MVFPRNALEQRIVSVWQDLLGMDEVGVDDNFYDLGGDSLLAMSMASAVVEQLDTRVPAAAILGAETIAEVAGRIEEGGRSESLVRVQPNGSQPPFFCVHPVMGGVMEFRDLAILLGSDQPFFAFQSIGRDGLSPPLSRVEQMASHYLAELRSVQPTGPYFLGGWSFGGLVAYEMARQLEQRGEKVAFLVLFQTICPRGHTRRRLSLRRHWKRMRPLGWWERLGYVTARLRFMRRLAGRRWRRWRTRPSDRPPAGLQRHAVSQDAEHVVFEANRVASDLYHPGPFGGRVFVIGLHGVDGYDGRLEAGWDRLATGGAEAITFLPEQDPAAEYLFQAPHLSRLAEELSRLIEVTRTPGDHG